MKILYAIQGTGNGHISRARDIIPLLEQKGDLDVLLSSATREKKVPFKVTYFLHGLGFTFGKKGGIDFWKTFKKMNSRKFYREIKSIPIKQYDIIINDFEPVSAWAGKLNNIPVISLSHQSAILNKLVPKPKKIKWVERLFIKYYAPTKYQYGFHFMSYDKHIFTPVIRNEIRNQEVTDKNYYVVYLPAYSDKKIIKVLSKCKDEKWHVFSKETTEVYLANNIIFYPVNNELFIEKMAAAKGVLCGAGFETPAEALFLKKKLLVIPMKAQFEQKCNAKVLEEMGVLVIKKLSLKHLAKIKTWIRNDYRVSVEYPNMTADIIDLIFENHVFELGEIHDIGEINMS
ncbi:glycosyltransferase family protein [Flavobacteriaceae bacterium S356]|uniref:Glycosyltransferase family protein n=1 Tax=Asprobacillus argus TaxID=3076534 RepID=A0ABU3LEL8_9FLAO|nr:glycosyltransferase family protein [Flavobacteriaceae bacterium S356]